MPKSSTKRRLTVQFNVRLAATDRARLRELARKGELTEAQIIRLLIKEAHERAISKKETL